MSPKHGGSPSLSCAKKDENIYKLYDDKQAHTDG
jgi:hypothetical protein